jgi:hypothetical protein
MLAECSKPACRSTPPKNCILPISSAQIAVTDLAKARLEPQMFRSVLPV